MLLITHIFLIIVSVLLIGGGVITFITVSMFSNSNHKLGNKAVIAIGLGVAIGLTLFIRSFS